MMKLRKEHRESQPSPCHDPQNISQQNEQRREKSKRKKMERKRIPTCLG